MTLDTRPKTLSRQISEKTSPLISISIVSHGQAPLITKALASLAANANRLDIEIIITINIPEQEASLATKYNFPVTFIRNNTPKGFGSNHNEAFRHARGEWFCVMNPDILVLEEPFAAMLEAAEKYDADLVAPTILAPDGSLEDSARKFPTPTFLLLKAIVGRKGQYHFDCESQPFTADWVGGMFMLFRVQAFRALRGFDEGFFMYYEDVDICARLWNSGRRVLVCPQSRVIHDARRESHRNLRYLSWHAGSLLRYLRKHWLRPLSNRRPE